MLLFLLVLLVFFGFGQLLFLLRSLQQVVSNGRGEEHRGEGTSEDTDEQSEDESTDGVTTEEEDGEQHDEGGT